MSDDKTPRGAADRAKVSAMEDHEVEYLARKHGGTPERIRVVVSQVGNVRADVEAALSKGKTD